MEARLEDKEVIIDNEVPMTIEESISQKGTWSKDLHAKFLNGPKKNTVRRFK